MVYRSLSSNASTPSLNMIIIGGSVVAGVMGYSVSEIFHHVLRYSLWQYWRHNSKRPSCVGLHRTAGLQDKRSEEYDKEGASHPEGNSHAL